MSTRRKPSPVRWECHECMPDTKCIKNNPTKPKSGWNVICNFKWRRVSKKKGG